MDKPGSRVEKSDMPDVHSWRLNAVVISLLEEKNMRNLNDKIYK